MKKLMKTSLEEITGSTDDGNLYRKWSAVFLEEYTDVVDFLTTTGLAKREYWCQKSDAANLNINTGNCVTSWYIPVIGKVKEGFIRFGRLELSIEKIDGKKYWCIWND
jgi:hypothetical protein